MFKTSGVGILLKHSFCCSRRFFWTHTPHPITHLTTVLFLPYFHLQTSLIKMLKNSKPGDSCIFYYSGHGTQGLTLSSQVLKGHIADSANRITPWHTWDCKAELQLSILRSSGLAAIRLLTYLPMSLLAGCVLQQSMEDGITVPLSVEPDQFMKVMTPTIIWLECVADKVIRLQVM